MNLDKNTVYETTDYSLFKYDKRNRKVNTKFKSSQVRKLVDSIRDNGMICPVVVDDNYVIVDGQHRLKIAEAYNLPVQYIYRKNSLVHIAGLNSDRKNWTLDDYVNYHLKEPSYSILKTLKDNSTLSYNALTAVITGKEVKGHDFRAGNLQLTDKEIKDYKVIKPKMDDILQYIAETRPSDLNKFTKTRVIFTLRCLIEQKTFSISRFKSKVSEYSGGIPSVNTNKDAAIMLTNIYNFKCSKNKISPQSLQSLSK